MIPLNAAVRNEDLTMNNRTTSCSGIQRVNHQLLFASVIAASFLVGIIIGAAVGFGIRSSLETGCTSMEMKNPSEGRMLDSSQLPNKALNLQEGSSIEMKNPSEGRMLDSSQLPKKALDFQEGSSMEMKNSSEGRMLDSSHFPKKALNFHEVFNMGKNCACHVPQNRLVSFKDINVTLNSWNPRKNYYVEIIPDQLCIPVCIRADSCNSHGEICQDNTTEVRSYQVLVKFDWSRSSKLEWIEVEVPLSCECKEEEGVEVYKNVKGVRIWSL